MSRSIIKERFLFSNKYRLLYCCNAKAGTTTWKVSTFFKLKQTEHTNFFPRQLSNYVSFFTVRHPFERLVSAYENKVVRNHAKYLHNATFLEFLKDFVIEEYHQCPENNLCMNIHWMPYIASCSYCNVPYKYVQKMETFDRDAEEILKEVGLEKFSKLHKHNNQRKSNISSQELTMAYFEKVPREIKIELYNIYKYDFESFNYSAQDYF